MKASQILAVLGFAALGFAQTLAPSPTESIGCEPHDDHWHCSGPRPTSSAPVTTPSTAPPVSTTATTSAHDDDDHDHSSGTGTIAPSPTESVGCSPHGDHWHCSGPRTSSTSIVTTTSGRVATTTGGGNSTATSTPVQAGAGRAGFGAAAVAIVGAVIAL